MDTNKVYVYLEFCSGFQNSSSERKASKGAVSIEVSAETELWTVLPFRVEQIPQARKDQLD